MTAQELKEKLSEDDIRSLLVEHMGADISYEDEDCWISTTVCHHGDKHKLYFYKESQAFHCYTQCGQLDILSVVIGYNDYEPNEIQRAINWICAKLNINTMPIGFGIHEQISDWDFIKSYKHHKKIVEITPLESYNPIILKIFQEMYYDGWIEEGINIDSMKKYNILYCVSEHKIIIPHYDFNERLIGVRYRSLLEEDIENYGKYAPYKHGKIFYNHPLGQNLFGLNHNIDAIKRKRKIMIVEAEKSVLQADSMFGENNFTVAVCGSNLSDYQVALILSLGVREVIIGLDKQYENTESKEYSDWIKHIKDKFADKLSPYVVVTVLLDMKNRLGYKDSPTDKGLNTLLELCDEKIYVSSNSF